MAPITKAPEERRIRPAVTIHPRIWDWLEENSGTGKLFPNASRGIDHCVFEVMAHRMGSHELAHAYLHETPLRFREQQPPQQPAKAPPAPAAKRASPAPAAAKKPGKGVLFQKRN